MIKALQQAHLLFRRKRKKRPLSPGKMKKIFAEEIQSLLLETSLAKKRGADTGYLTGKIVALRDMRVKLGLGQYTYRDELLEVIS